MIVTTIEYALLAGAAYKSTRSNENKIPSPGNWNKLNPDAGLDFRQDDLTGFEAVAFEKNGNIVISFAGTYERSIADKLADAALGAGILHSQLVEAALYYEEIKALYPDASIVFTGHSLGGGLAALMGVFFNRPAVTCSAIRLVGEQCQSIRIDCEIGGVWLYRYRSGNVLQSSARRNSRYEEHFYCIGARPIS